MVAKLKEKETEDNFSESGSSESMKTQNSNESEKTKWSSDGIKLLLDLRLGKECLFDRPACKKKKLWDKISGEMKEIGQYNISGNECNNKYRNLLQTYRQNKEKRLKKTGESKVTWEFFDTFDSVLGSKSSSAPPKKMLSTSIEELSNDDDDDSSASKEVGTSSKIDDDCLEIPHATKKKGTCDLSLSKYLYFKKVTKEEDVKKENARWEEKKALKMEEIKAINNLADAIRMTASEGNDKRTNCDGEKKKKD